MKKMTHTERLERLINGQETDRMLYSAWGHVMNYCDRDAKDFAKATIQFQNANDFDFIKIMSNPYYMVEDAGVELQNVMSYATPVSRVTDRVPIKRQEDWASLALPKVQQGALRREKEAISRVVDYYKGEVPVIATIFTPLMNLTYLMITAEQIDEAYRRYGTYIPLLEKYLNVNRKNALSVLRYYEELNQEYMEELLRAGVDGFFYCTEYARGYWTDDSLYEEYEKQYDLRILKSVEHKAKFNILHVCGQDALEFDWVLDYPVHAFNWDDQTEKNWSMSAVRKRTDKILIGGLDRHSDLKGSSREEIKKTIQLKYKRALQEAGTNIILSGGCDWDMDSVYRFYIWHEVMEELSENTQI